MKSYKGRAISIPGDEVREFKFKVYHHSQKITASFESGVYSVDAECRIWRSRGRSSTGVWHLELLQVQDPKCWPVFIYYRKHGHCAQYEVLALRAMQELSKAGIDPIGVRSWGRYIRGEVRRRVEDALIEWREKEEYAVAD